MPRAKTNTVAVDITELLHEDHMKVRDLFFQFSKSEDESEKESLVEQILAELYIHAAVEEEIVYPAIAEEADEAENLVDEAETEHRVVKFLMAELSQMTAEDEKFDAKVTVLCELVNHHIREEEKEMFEKLRESGADLEEIAQHVLQRKEELKAEPLPPMNASLEMGDAAEDEEGEEAQQLKALDTKRAPAKKPASGKRRSA